MKLVRPVAALVGVLLFAVASGARSQAIPEPAASAPAPAAASTRDPEGADEQRVQLLVEASRLIAAGHAEGALAGFIDKVIAEFEAKYAADPRKIYSARTRTESLLYLLEAANDQLDRREALVLSQTWVTAYYLRGYALVELKRLPEAQQALERAAALAPRNAQVLGELGQLALRQRNWTKAQGLFERAEAAAQQFAPEATKVRELGLALRGQGYVAVEEKRYDDARKFYLRCLEINPKDAFAQAQLRFVESAKATPKAQ